MERFLFSFFFIAVWKNSYVIITAFFDKVAISVQLSLKRNVIKRKLWFILKLVKNKIQDWYLNVNF